jgi:hypothetical protein
MEFRAAPDLEAQPQDCAWSTIPVHVHNRGSVVSRHDATPNALFLNRGTVLSRHDDTPLPTLLPYPDEPPPAYTYPPPVPPISGSDSSGSEPATNRRVDGHHLLRLLALVIAFILAIGLFVTALYFTFFKV